MTTKYTETYTDLARFSTADLMAFHRDNYGAVARGEITVREFEVVRDRIRAELETRQKKDCK